jgi:hypothetical protein
LLLSEKWSLHSEIDRVFTKPIQQNVYVLRVQGLQNKQPSETGAGLAHFFGYYTNT